MPIVQLHHVRKVYDTKVAVEDLSFTIEPGTMFGLLGPNGSGKTSSIRMMIGITVPDSGSVSLFDQPFARRSLGRVGYLPEERGLYKKMNVLDQLVFLGQLHYLSASVAAATSPLLVRKAANHRGHSQEDRRPLQGHAAEDPVHRALLHDPDLIIMDEPFSGLDPVNAALLMDTLVDLRREGKAVLFSTHRMDQVEKLCDNIALIHRGHLVLSGSMREIKSSYPRNRVHIHFEGDDGFPAAARTSKASSAINGHAEIKLRPSATLADDAQSLLAEALRHARITRFEVTEPTLEEIFIEKVQENSPEKHGLELSTELEEPEGSYLDA